MASSLEDRRFPSRPAAASKPAFRVLGLGFRLQTLTPAGCCQQALSPACWRLSWQVLCAARMVWPLYIPGKVAQLTAGSKMDRSEAELVINQAKALVYEQVRPGISV